jgi:hypothetical protein
MKDENDGPTNLTQQPMTTNHYHSRDSHLREDYTNYHTHTWLHSARNTKLNSGLHPSGPTFV